MLQQIVVGIDGSEDSFAALQQSILIAKHVTCCIKSVFVVDRRKTRIPYMYSDRNIDEAFERASISPDRSVRSFYDRVENDIRSYAERCLNTSNGKIKSGELTPISVIKEGYPASELREEALSGGMLALGRRGEDAEYIRSFLGSTAEDLIRSSPRPILLATSKPREVKRVLFLYSKSQSSEASLQFYVNTMENLAEKFYLLSVGDNEGMKHRIEEEMTYLKNHEIDAEWITSTSPVPEAVSETAEKISADLLLIGATGKSALKDFFVGTTTSRLVHDAKIPILIVY